MKRKLIFACLIAILLLLTFVSCSLDHGIDSSPYVAVDGMILNRPGAVLYFDNEMIIPSTRITLIAAISPADASNKLVTWGSSNVNVVTVDQNGTVIPSGVGTAFIIAITDDGGFVDICEVTVLDIRR